MSAPTRCRRLGGWLALCAAMAAVLGIVGLCDRAESIASADMLVSGAQATGTHVIVQVVGPALY